MMSQGEVTDRWLVMSCEVVAAYVRYNTVPMEQVANLIAGVRTTLERLHRREITPASKPEANFEPTTAAQIRASITHDALISFEDGREYKALKRHLTALGLTPDEYRAKWGLPSDYPMVSSAYSWHRSTIAKAIGLGRAGVATG